MGSKLQFCGVNGDRRAATSSTTQTMQQPLRQMTPRRVSHTQSQAKTRLEPKPAHLTDLYRQRMPVEVLNLTRSSVSLKVSERFTVNLPVLVEYAGLLVVGNVRHCVKADGGGYVLGLSIHKMVDRCRQEIVEPEYVPRFGASSVARAGAA